MKRSILGLISILVFCNVVNGYESTVSWIHGNSPAEYNLSEPQTTSYPVYFSVPLCEETFFNKWTAEQVLGGTPTLSINPIEKEIMLEFQEPPSEPYSETFDPVCGLEGHFGLLEEGQWVFVFRCPGYLLWDYFDVIPSDAAGGVKAEYFADKIPRGIPCLTQIEPNIDYNWGNNVVACSLWDQVSARWTAELEITESDTYTFSTTSDDGVRLYLDGELIIDNWTVHAPMPDTSEPKYLDRGTYSLQMEWFEADGGAVAQLYWESSTMERQIIPPSPLQPGIGDIGDEAVEIIEIEGFEYYTDNEEVDMAIFQTWIGGSHPFYPGANNGTDMRIGHLEPSYAEQRIVYSGRQSMPLYYDNSNPPFYSQADRTWDWPQDWTRVEGTTSQIVLSLFVHGRPNNSSEPFYIRLEDTAGRDGLIFNPDPDILLDDKWNLWWIPLSEFDDYGVDLNRINMMSIGIGIPPTGEEPDGLLNDECVNAIPIANVTNRRFDTTDCTYDGPGHCMQSPNIWYCYSAPRSCNVTVSLCGSSYDTMLAIYSGCGCEPNLSDLIACNDDACGPQSEITFFALAGNKYLVEVGGWSDTSWGPGVLNINCEGDRDSPPMITSVAGPNGSISPSGKTVVNYGNDLIFTAHPDPGFQVDMWYVDGEVVNAGGSTYTLSNIQADHTIHVTFRLPPNNSDYGSSGMVYVDQIIIQTIGQSGGGAISPGVEFGILRGTVTSGSTGLPVENPNFTLEPVDYPEWIAPDGSYVIFLIQGQYTLTVTADGFIPYIEHPLIVSWDTQRDIVLTPVTPAP